MRAILIPSGKRRAALGAAGAMLALAFALAVASNQAAARRGERASQSAATATVNIRESAFHPGKLTVGRGTRVVFVNRDSIAHRPARSGSFNTGRIAPGKSASVRFGNSGTFPYICTIHHFMHGKIVVR